MAHKGSSVIAAQTRRLLLILPSIRIREFLRLRVLVFPEGRAEEFRFALVEGDDEEGGAGFLVILGILGGDSVDDGEGGEDIALQHAAPMVDGVLHRQDAKAAKN